jgi:hypothetical protein
VSERLALSPDRVQFASDLARALAPAKVEVVAEDFALRVDGRLVVQLGKPFAEYQDADVPTKGKVLRRWASSIAQARTRVLPEFSEVRDKVVPHLRSINSQALLELAGGGKAAFAYEMVAAPVLAGAAVDFGDVFALVTEEMRRRWGVSMAQILAAARENLAARSVEGLSAVSAGVYRGEFGDGNASARLLLDETLRRLDVKGDPVALVPNRDALIVTGADDDEGLARAAALARDALGRGEPLSGTPLRLRSGAWEEFSPPSGSAANEAFRLLRLTASGMDYARQAEALKQREGDEVFIASFQIFQSPHDGQWRSVSVWTEGVVTLLPRTDAVILVSPGFANDPRRTGPWDWAALEAAVGDRLQRRDRQPVRFLTKGFPTEQMITEIRRAGAILPSSQE